MALGIFVAVVILFLVRRDHLHGPYAIWWIGVAATVGVLGFFPRFFDYLAVYLGVSYPPVLAIIVGFSMLLVKILTMDLERSRQERLIRRLTQRLAMLEEQKPMADVLSSAQRPASPISSKGGGPEERK